jgi:N-acetylglucosamine-6-phosphate deacetylase
MDPHLPDGVHRWRPGTDCRKEGHAVYLDGTSTLAGSCAPLDQCVRNLCAFTGASLAEALLAATRNPALALGGEVAKTKGQLKEGFHADLCVLDRKGIVVSTWVMGREVWRDRRRGQVGSDRALGSQGRDGALGSRWLLVNTTSSA